MSSDELTAEFTKELFTLVKDTLDKLADMGMKYELDPGEFDRGIIVFLREFLEMHIRARVAATRTIQRLREAGIL